MSPNREIVAALHGIQEDVRESADANRRTRRDVRGLIVAVALIAVVVLGLVAWNVIRSGNAQSTANTAKTQVDDVSTKADRADTVSATARRRVRANEAKVEQAPVAAARRVVQYFVDKRPIKGLPTPGPRGPEGPQGIPGVTPSRAQILQVVKIYCSGTPSPCQGPEGPAGKDGADGVNTAVTAEQVADEVERQITGAVAAYCADHNECRGADGDDASDAQVSSAVQSYCDAHNGCQGPSGANGADAPPPTQEQVNAGVAAYCSANPGACAPPAATPPAAP